jgi:protoheme IX farnesyltransferase
MDFSMERIKLYFSLTKPGVLFGNVISGVAGFLLASYGTVNIVLFLATTIGMTLIIASACVLNNYFDRDIDSVMERTKKRAIASGEIKGRNGVIFSIILGILGVLILFLWTNLLVVGIGIFGFVVYVWGYGMYGKRKSVHGTLIGSVSGAMPILAGYCAVTNTINLGAVLVFLILFFWQLPEFYSISVYRRDEYKAAKVPVISVVKGIPHAKREILAYTIAFVLSTLALTIFEVAGYTYFVVMAVLGIYWIWLSVKLLQAKDNNIWGRKMFKFSLIILLVFCFMISVNSFLP